MIVVDLKRDAFTRTSTNRALPCFYQSVGLGLGNFVAARHAANFCALLAILLKAAKSRAVNREKFGRDPRSTVDTPIETVIAISLPLFDGATGT